MNRQVIQTLHTQVFLENGRALVVTKGLLLDLSAQEFAIWLGENPGIRHRAQITHAFTTWKRQNAELARNAADFIGVVEATGVLAPDEALSYEAAVACVGVLWPFVEQRPN